MRSIRLITTLLLALGIAVLVHGAEPEPAAPEQTPEQERAALLAEIDAIRNKESSLAEAMAAGEERSILCAACHQRDGNAVKEGVPVLASQNPAYLLRQIDKFATGAWSHFVMTTLAKSFTREDKVNLAIYFSEQKRNPVAVDESLVELGKGLYEQKGCLACHGADGRGASGFAYVAGQKQDYSILTMQRFRALAGNPRAQHAASRYDPSMVAVSEGLGDKAIRALAAYMASLQH